MNKDEVIPQLENDFVDWGARIAVGSLASRVPIFHVPVFRGIAEWAARAMLRPVVAAFDMLGFYTFKAAENNKDAVAYQDQITAYKNAVKSGDKNAIAKAQAEKNARFARLARFNG